MKSRYLKILVWSSSIYILFPIIIFFLSFIKNPLGIFLAVSTLLLSFFCLHNCTYKPQLNDQDIFAKIKGNLFWYILVGLIVSAWYFISGIGGLGLGHTTDATTGERIIFDLVHNDWPLKISIPSDSPASSLKTSTYNLVYYLAFYLPAGLAGKICNSFAVGCWVECIWGYIGTCLAVCWFFWFIDFKGKSWEIIGCLGILLFFRTTSFITSYICSFYSLFYWANSTTILYGSPQHAIAAWLTVSLLYAAYRNDIHLRTTFICLASVIIHSPFTLPGVFFLFLICIFKHNIINWKNIVLGVGMLLLCFLPCALYISSNNFSFPMTLVFLNESFTFFKYLWGIIVLLVIPALVIFWGYKTLTSSEKKICLIIFASLFLSISFNMGFCNDFPIRVSMPALFLLNILLSKILTCSQSKTLKILILTFVLIAASTYTRYIYQRLPSLSVPPTRNIKGFLYGEDITTYQTRMGNASSFFFRKLSK